MSAGDEQRRRLERNLHDGAQQHLVAVALKLKVARAKLDGNPEYSAKILDDAMQELATGLEELRELARGLHPAILTDNGLAPALQALGKRLPIEVDLDVPVERLAPQLEATTYYIVSEALTNVVKHAGAGNGARGDPPGRRDAARRRDRRWSRRRRRRQGQRDRRPARPRGGGRRAHHGRQPARARHRDHGGVAAQRLTQSGR